MLSALYAQHKETFHNFLWRCLQILGKQGIAFVIFIFCSKMLSIYDFGVYNYVLAILFFLIMFGDFGISTATSKYVAEYSVSDHEKLKATLFNAGIMVLALGVVISIVTIIFGGDYLKENYRYVLFLLPLVFLAPLTSLYDGVYRGLKRFKHLSAISTSCGAISVAVAYVLVNRFGLLGAFISQNVFYALLLVGLAVGYREFHFKLNKKVALEIGRYSFSYGLALIGNYLFIRFGILILGHYNYIEQIAAYEVINKVFLLLLLPFSLLGQVIAPDFSLLSSRGEYREIYARSKKITIIFGAIGLLLGVILYFFAPLVFKIFLPDYYGKEYFGIAFTLSLVTYVANVWAATFDAGILVPVGYAKMMAVCYILLGVFGAGLGLLLLKIFGFTGVLASFAICSIIMVLALRTLYFLSMNKRIREDSKFVS